MRYSTPVFACLLMALISAADHNLEQSNIEFVCFRKQSAAKQCHYNFKVDGANYRFVDIGCRFDKRDEVIEKVKAGELGLARDWKVECGESKEKVSTNSN